MTIIDRLMTLNGNRIARPDADPDAMDGTMGAGESPSPSAVLTARELECIRLLSQGLTAKEIGKALGVTGRTVERHLDAARHKLHATNRFHLLAKAFRAGIVR